eukprot:SAG22_NODE_401_length_11080_cov_18.258082_11_plen_106_part_00
MLFEPIFKTSKFSSTAQGCRRCATPSARRPASASRERDQAAAGQVEYSVLLAVRLGMSELGHGRVGVADVAEYLAAGRHQEVLDELQCFAGQAEIQVATARNALS